MTFTLGDDDEFEKFEMPQPRHPGEFELGRGTQGDFQPFEIAASRVADGDPRIQRFVLRGTGFDGAEFQGGRERGRERHDAGHARGESAHDVHLRRHRRPAGGVHTAGQSRAPVMDAPGISRLRVSRWVGPFTFVPQTRK